jgi:hypothetical protein
LALLRKARVWGHQCFNHVLPYDVIGNATKSENRRPAAVHYIISRASLRGEKIAREESLSLRVDLG